MNIKGTGRLELFTKDENGEYHKVHDVTEELNATFSEQSVIDKSIADAFKPMEISATFEISEDKIRMANAKDVTPKGELE